MVQVISRLWSSDSLQQADTESRRKSLAVLACWIHKAVGNTRVYGNAQSHREKHRLGVHR